MTVRAYAWLAQSKKYQLFKDFLSVSVIFSIASRTENVSVSDAFDTSDINTDGVVRLMNTIPVKQ